MGIGGWVGPKTGLNDVESEQSFPYWDSNSDLSVVQPVASRYTEWAMPAPRNKKITVNFYVIMYQRFVINNVFIKVFH
jgi:hypothetical protein